jgi:AcrR family transcriptional regulator
VRRTQAERRAETERRLLEATMEIIALRGVRAVTLAAVGEAAGYSRGIVTHQFGSRQGLLDALTLELQNRFVPPETDDVLELIDAYLASFEERPLDTRVYAVLWAEAQAGDADLLPAFEARDARFRATLSGYLGGNDAMAGVLVALLRGVTLLRPDDVREQVRTLLARGVS